MKKEFRSDNRMDLACSIIFLSVAFALMFYISSLDSGLLGSNVYLYAGLFLLTFGIVCFWFLYFMNIKIVIDKKLVLFYRGKKLYQSFEIDQYDFEFYSTMNPEGRNPCFLVAYNDNERINQRCFGFDSPDMQEMLDYIYKNKKAL